MLLLVVAALAVIATEARAAESDGLRWPDIVAAIDRDPRFAASRSATSVASAEARLAASAPNPEVEASGGRGFAREGGAERNEWEVELQLPLEWLARRGPAVAGARAGVAQADAELAALRGEVTAELHRLYAGAAYQQALASSLVATEEQVSTLASIVRRRAEAGEARPVEVPRMEIEVERVRAERAAAEIERDVALGQLSWWLARPVSSVELPARAMAVPPAELAAAPEAHPRVRAAQARAEAARAEVDGARRERIPAFSVGAFYASELDRRAAGITLTTELPLWNWNGPQVARATARADAEAALAEAARRELAATLTQARGDCERSAGNAERHATLIVPRAEESARTLERSFELGEANLIDVIDARRVLLEARRAALASAREREIDCGNLLILSGREIP
jgi:cobalt-zinc-cadmium efflux system outer membrane protein